MIRKYKESDYNVINILGRELSPNFKFEKNENNDCFVYIEKDDVIGFITYQILSDYSEVLDIFVHINHRNKNIGTQLLDSCIDDLKNKNVNKVTLEVKTTNVSAINLYKKNQFKIVSIRKKYYENNTIDAYLMVREL